MADKIQRVGDLAKMQIEQALESTSRMSPKTGRLLRRALPALAAMVEKLCPVAMGMGPGGLQVSYGPYLGGETGLLFILVNSSGDAIAATSPWPSGLTYPTGQSTRAEIWAAVHDAIAKDDASFAIVGVCALAGVNARAAVESRCREITQAGFYPALCTLAGRRKGEAAGASAVIALPPTLELTFADAPAMAS
jgi:hypothetical protein